MERTNLIETRIALSRARADVRRRRDANEKIRNHNEKEKALAEKEDREPNLKKSMEMKSLYERVDELVALEQKIISTNVGDYHPSILCKDVSHSKCSQPVKWHPGLKTYALCGDSQCPNYYLCTSCGKEFGKHF